MAAAAHQVQLPLYTYQLKDMTPLIGDLAINRQRDMSGRSVQAVYW